MLGTVCCAENVLSAAAPADLSPLPRVQERLKAKQPVKLVALGDSITTYFGNRSRHGGYYPVPMSVAYYGVFAGYLKMAHPEADVKLINKGVGGETADRGLRRLEADVLSHEPDLVFVMYGANDGRAGRDLEQYASELRQIAAKVQATGADVILVAPTMSLVDLAWLLPYRQAVLDLAEELECPVLDGTLALWPVDDDAHDLQDAHQYLARHFPPDGDDIHPGINGHFQMGRRLWQQLAGPPRQPPLKVELRPSGPVQLPGKVGMSLIVTNGSEKSWEGAVQVFFPQGMPIKDAVVEKETLANKAAGTRHFLPPARLVLKPGESRVIDWELELPDEAELTADPGLFRWLKSRAGVGIAAFGLEHNDLFYRRPEFFPVAIEAAAPRLVAETEVGLKLSVANTGHGIVEGEVFAGKESKGPLSAAAGARAAFETKLALPAATNRPVRSVMPVKVEGDAGKLYGLNLYGIEAVPAVDALHRSVTVDGGLTEWGNDEWHGFAAGGAKAEFAVRKSGETLFVAMRCADPFLSFEHDGIWTGDGFELFLDARPTPQLGTPGLVFQLGFFPPKHPGQAVIVAKGSGAHDFDTSTVQTAWRRTDDGYVMEVALPVSAFARQGWPDTRIIGFGVACNNAEAAGQERTQHHWAGDLNNHKTPVKLGLLRSGSGAPLWRVLCAEL